MKIDVIELGDFQTNCYILRSSAQTKKCLIIDPGFEPEPLLKFLATEAIEPEKILLTHGHCDHIAGIGPVLEQFGRVPVCISRLDSQMLTDSNLNLSLTIGSLINSGPADEKFSPGDIVGTDGLKMQVLATPGHTPGSVSFYCPDQAMVITGDALFAGSVGRHDFPGSDYETLLKGIREQLFVLPEHTKVYPGHGPATSIGTEKTTNPFFR